MSGVERGHAYLSIPPDYAFGLGGPRWSLRCDAVEWPDGSALALAEELRPLLGGVFSRTLVPPFAYVLNVLHLMKSGRLSPFDRLRRAFETARGSANLSDNAGLLIAELCADLPPSPELASLDDVLAALRLRQLHGERPRPSMEPPLCRVEFELRVSEKLQTFDDDALLHWLKFGTAPPPKAPELAKTLESLPLRVARLLTRARARPRLVGAAALTPVVDAALSLPPRRRTPDQLPQGGYADVTTRGEPERLLPGQFALDADEFVRRFAENELLYFEREEPHAAERPGRTLVLDQGVRTWGSVRLALTAAALALLKKDPKRTGRVRLAATSTPDLVDPAEAELDELADLLEASDLTANPAAAVARALADDGEELRDVVILTHPRALREPDVLAAGKSRRKGDRVFALSVDDDGRAEFAEWSTGGLLPIRAFRVDLAVGEAARVPEEVAPTPTAGSWAGDAEPIGFPFRPGLVAEPLNLAFDADGCWLVVAGRDGFLHGLTVDGGAVEVLPRPYKAGVLMKIVLAVLGVRGGVVVCGLVETTAAPDGAYWAAHYDFAARRVTVHDFGRVRTTAHWSAYPDLHCVAMRYEPPAVGCAVDLSTGGVYPDGRGTDLVSRARAAWSRSEDGGSRSLPILGPGDTTPHTPYLYAAGSLIDVRNADPPWAQASPTRDGRPMLAGWKFEEARLAGDTLCALASRGGERNLMLFARPGVPTGDVPHHRGEPFALSPDGHLLVRRRWHREVVVSESRTPSTAKVVVPQAALHNGLGVRLEVKPFLLIIRVGGFEHAFRVSDNALSHELTRGGARTDRPTPPPLGLLPTDYDTARFPRQGRAAAGPLRAVPDRLGQVLLLTDTGKVVASFVVRRDRAAAWLPGGVVWGDSTLLGGPPTPNAARWFAATIVSAGG